MTARSVRSARGARSRFVIVTLDAHLGAAFECARASLTRELPALELQLHVASDWSRDPGKIAACRADLARADFIVVTQLFMEDQVEAIRDVLEARCDHCSAVMVAIAAPELMRCTRMGKFSMAPQAASRGWSPLALMRRLAGGRKSGANTGERQLRALRRVPQLLRYIPGTAQDVRNYYVMLQYWLGASEDNLANLVRFFASKYGAETNPTVASAPREYPEIGVYHPDWREKITDRLPTSVEQGSGCVGLLLMRSYLLAGNTAHYDAVIRAFERRGLRVIAAFASGLDNRPAIERYFTNGERPMIDALVSLTGFSLVGGPAYSDASAATSVLASLDVPYLVAQPLEFQTIEEWRDDARGLNSLQATLQVAIPELEGATNPIVFAGKSSVSGSQAGVTVPIAERTEQLVARVAKLVALRRMPRAQRRIAIVLFGFPPNTGNAGTAAYLEVFASLARTLRHLRSAGYVVDDGDRDDAIDDADVLRRMIVEGNSERHGTIANVFAKVPLDAHVRSETRLAELEAAWGAAPGRQLSDGSSLFVLGAQFGNVFVGVQPAFGYEGDPMRLLFEKGFAPTHAFSAFYRWLRDDFKADALLHFGTHGALEFMPGKQTGLDAACWPDSLIGDVPNMYLYASNNPSEGTLAKRRGAATLVSYLTPPVANAGLYRGLLDLKGTLDRLRSVDWKSRSAERDALLVTAQQQAADLDLAAAEPKWNGDAASRVDTLRQKLLEFEYTLIPDGLHCVGRPMSVAQRITLLQAMAREPRADVGLPALREIVGDDVEAQHDVIRRCVVECDDVMPPAARGLVEYLRGVDAGLRENDELDAIVHALDARFVAPAPGGDLLRNPAVLPTGRNVYGFDPYRVPTASAMGEGRAQAERLLARHMADGQPFPETIAVVLWGTDNMKSEGGAIAQVLALMGAAPRFDGLGRLCGARLVPLAELGRPRVDVVVTLSGVFRDLFPLQTKLLAEAALLCARADEPATENFVRAHAIAHRRAIGCDEETAALRVFSNADGTYGANVNLLVDAGTWNDERELGDAFAKRKSFAYGLSGVATAQPALFSRALAGTSLSYQMLDSIELGATDVDQYFDSLGGLNRAVASARGTSAPAYMGDQTGTQGRVRTVAEQVELESRTRLLNPRWYEGMLRSGYEGVRNISSRVTNTVGWSATASATPAWVYRDVAQTFVLDDAMRERLAGLNSHAALQIAGRLLEANDRGYWQPTDEMLDALRDAAASLEDRIEGVTA